MMTIKYVPVTVETPDGLKGIGVAKATTDSETGLITLDMRIIDTGVVEKMRAQVPLGVAS